MSKEKQYCVHCADEYESDELLWFAELPYNVASANKGESGCVCQSCHDNLSTTHKKMKKPTKKEKENAEDFIFNCVENRGGSCDSWAMAQWLVGIMDAEAIKTISDKHKKENA